MFETLFPDVEVTPELALQSDLGLESMQVLELVEQIEDHFDIAVPLNDLAEVDTLNQLLSLIQSVDRT